MKTLSELSCGIEQCQSCPLSGERHKVVPGEGPDDAKVMFIGEAPGKDENISGRPFVGRSGQLLRRLIEQSGLAPSDVFITSVLKCRPPENRNPLPVEMEACKMWLDEQIEALNPQVIVPLGNFACKVLLDKVGITAMRGSCFEKAGIKYCPTFHPAAATRDPRRVPYILEDLKKVRKLLQ
tara:strand:+ start:1197 stop:1739 length:543 start_codon:yes stop_codon:yes gene_type:complete